MAEIALKSLIYLHLMVAKNTLNFGGETLFPLLNVGSVLPISTEEPLFVCPG
jgi:hypothetical protein